MKHKLESRLSGEIPITLDADYITLMAKGKELKSLLMIRREWKSWLKTQHSETKIIASGPITSWQIDGETVEIVTNFFFFFNFGSKITADGDCSHEIKRPLVPWKKSFDQPRQHIKKQRYYFTNKGPSSQSCGFPLVMYGCELDYKES